MWHCAARISAELRLPVRGSPPWLTEPAASLQSTTSPPHPPPVSPTPFSFTDCDAHATNVSYSATPPRSVPNRNPIPSHLIPSHTILSIPQSSRALSSSRIVSQTAEHTDLWDAAKVGAGSDHLGQRWLQRKLHQPCACISESLRITRQRASELTEVGTRWNKASVAIWCLSALTDIKRERCEHHMSSGIVPRALKSI